MPLVLQYSSNRHRQLMTASEYALRDACESTVPIESRIAINITGDDKKYKEWEHRHASLLLPVAEQRASKNQILALRNANVHLVHRRAFFRYLQTHKVRGTKREQLFRLFHSTMDFDAAVLAEHRHYMLAFSSGISTDHIIDVMQDDRSTVLGDRYEKLFGRIFEMKCFIATAADTATTKLVRTSLRDAQGQLLRIRRRMETEVPSEHTASFERMELIHRTGRYEPKNYLNV